MPNGVRQSKGSRGGKNNRLRHLGLLLGEFVGGKTCFIDKFHSQRSQLKGTLEAIAVLVSGYCLTYI